MIENSIFRNVTEDLQRYRTIVYPQNSQENKTKKNQEGGGLQLIWQDTFQNNEKK